MKKDIQKIIKNAIEKLQKEGKFSDFKIPEIKIDCPSDKKFGDYSSNIAMVLAGVVKEEPMEIAASVKQQALSSKCEEISKIEIVKPGYINFYLSEKYLQDLVGIINNEKESFGNSKIGKRKKVMVEYSQPNTHKEFHIGHLRNVFIGSSLVNVLRKAGFKVLAANYIGDTGTHIAKCLWGIKKFHSDENLDDIKNKAQFLGKVYSEAAKAISENSEYENEFKRLQQNFEKRDKQLIKLWEKTKQWSLKEFQKIYDELGVSFDIYFWESEEEIAGKKMLPELLKKGIAKESEGAIIADLEKYNLRILVLLRKDGSVLYGLKDISLAVKKFKDYKVDRNIIIVDVRQDLYFKQVFKILELMGFKKDMRHIGYDFVSLKGEGMMSSRLGNIVPAKFLMNEIIEKVKEKFPQTKIEKEIGLGALKFYMLKYSSSSKIEFNINEALKLNGATGPYVQYAHARIASILVKSEKLKVKSEKKPPLSSGHLPLEKGERGGNINLNLLVHEKELDLMRELNKFPELVEEIARSYETHKLPHYAIKLADKFHSFYAECRVIDENNSELSLARQNLINAVRIVLAEVLRLMGVSAPESM